MNGKIVSLTGHVFSTVHLALAVTSHLVAFTEAKLLSKHRTLTGRKDGEEKVFNVEMNIKYRKQMSEQRISKLAERFSQLKKEVEEGKQTQTATA